MIPCIIPARGGSKGIPRKNLTPVCGKPLVVWSIEQALGASQVDHVIVATDDAEIKRVATSTGYLGVTVFDRSPESATDDAPTEAVLKEVVSELWADAEGVVLLQPTSPVRTSEDIDQAIELFRATNADSVFSAREIEGYTWDASGRVLSPRDGPRRPRQAESRRVLEENGSIYVFRPDMLLRFGNRLGGRIVPYIQHPLDSFQLDEPEDIPTIEALLAMRQGVGSGMTLACGSRGWGPE